MMKVFKTLLTVSAITGFLFATVSCNTRAGGSGGGGASLGGGGGISANANAGLGASIR